MASEWGAGMMWSMRRTASCFTTAPQSFHRPHLRGPTKAKVKAKVKVKVKVKVKAKAKAKAKAKVKAKAKAKAFLQRFRKGIVCDQSPRTGKLRPGDGKYPSPGTGRGREKVVPGRDEDGIGFSDIFKSRPWDGKKSSLGREKVVPGRDEDGIGFSEI